MKPLAASQHHGDNRHRHGRHLARKTHLEIPMGSEVSLWPIEVRFLPTLQKVIFQTLYSENFQRSSQRDSYNKAPWFTIGKQMTYVCFNEQPRDLSDPWTNPFSPNLSFPLSSTSMLCFQDLSGARKKPKTSVRVAIVYGWWIMLCSAWCVFLPDDTVSLSGPDGRRWKHSVSGMRFLWQVESLKTTTMPQASVSDTWATRVMLTDSEAAFLFRQHREREWPAYTAWEGEVSTHNDFQHVGKPAPSSPVKARQRFTASCSVWLQEGRNYASWMSFVPGSWQRPPSLERYFSQALPTADYKMKAVYQFCDSLLPGFLSHLFFQLF